MNRRLNAIVEREGDDHVALCPEAGSRGDTVAEARDNLAEAPTLFFEIAPAMEIDKRLHREVHVIHVEVAVGQAARPVGPGVPPYPRVRRFRGGEKARQPCRGAPDAALAVPVPDHRESRTGTPMSIIRQSGVPRSESE